MRIDNDMSQYSIVSTVFGTFSLFLWLIPILSVFTALFTIYTGIKGFHSEKNGLSKVGLFFGIVSLILTLLRSGFVNGVIL